MAVTNRLFTYSATPIPGASQSGNLAISTTYIPGYTWWGGPDENLGYVIAHTDTSPGRTERNKGAAISGNTVGFWRTATQSDSSFLSLFNGLFNQNYATASAAANWLNSNGYWTSWIGSSFDADAQAFFTAAGITDTTQKTAVNDLVLGLKADSLWTKMSALYPFVGGTATTHKWNLKDPRDLDTAFRIQFYGGWGHDSNGIQGFGFNNYADTFVSTNTAAIPDLNNHWSFYNRTMSTNTTYQGIFDVAQFVMFGWGGCQNCNFILGAQNYTGSSNSTSGFINGTTRESINRSNFYKDGVQIVSSRNPVSMITANFYLGATNYYGSYPNFYGDNNIAFVSLGGELTATDAANLYTRVQAFQTTLGRQV